MSNEKFVNSQQRLLRQMADGQFHSGEELGEFLCVSRAAVWKQLQKLEALGLMLESVKGKGYRPAGRSRVIGCCHY